LNSLLVTLRNKNIIMTTLRLNKKYLFGLINRSAIEEIKAVGM